jgi:hypothetical protein
MGDLLTCDECGASVARAEFYQHLTWHEALNRRLADLETRMSNGPF